MTLKFELTFEKYLFAEDYWVAQQLLDWIVKAAYARLLETNFSLEESFSVDLVTYWC